VYCVMRLHLVDIEDHARGMFLRTLVYDLRHIIGCMVDIG
jgi:hypothetical protein